MDGFSRMASPSCSASLLRRASLAQSRSNTTTFLGSSWVGSSGAWFGNPRHNAPLQLLNRHRNHAPLDQAGSRVGKIETRHLARSEIKRTLTVPLDQNLGCPLATNVPRKTIHCASPRSQLGERYAPILVNACDGRHTRVPHSLASFAICRKDLSPHRAPLGASVAVIRGR
jgi:hypothetical protein